jgi:hypothetical protein
MAAVSQQVLLSMLGSDLTILLQCHPLELVVELSLLGVTILVQLSVPDLIPTAPLFNSVREAANLGGSLVFMGHKAMTIKLFSSRN